MFFHEPYQLIGFCRIPGLNPNRAKWSSIARFGWGIAYGGGSLWANLGPLFSNKRQFITDARNALRA